VDNPILKKTIIIFILVLWLIDEFRARKRKCSDPAMETADAKERHEWSYLKWGFRTIQVAATVHIFVQLIQVVLR